jgi:hypothetical protein
MALLYYVKVSSKPADVSLFPPSLQEWTTIKLLANLKEQIYIAESNGSTAVLFTNEAELNSFVDAIKLTSEQQAQFNEWKSAHNITVTYSVHELPASDITVPNPF